MLVHTCPTAKRCVPQPHHLPPQLRHRHRRRQARCSQPLSPRGAQPESGPPSSARHPAQQHNPIVEWFAVNYPGLNAAAFQNEKELMNWLREENYEKYMEISDLLSVWGYTMPVGGNK